MNRTPHYRLEERDAMAVEITDGGPLSTKKNRRKTRFQLQVSNCRRMLRQQSERIAAIQDPRRIEALQAILDFEQVLFQLENNLPLAETQEST